MPTLTTNPALTNFHGRLGPDMIARLQAALDHPRQGWNAASSVILRDDIGLGLTLWQAVRKVDPTFPNNKGDGDSWDRYPDQVLVARALKLAAGLPKGGR